MTSVGATWAEGEMTVPVVVSRRAMVGVAAFAVPAVALVAVTPAFAASGAPTVLVRAVPSPPPSSSATSASQSTAAGSTSASVVSASSTNAEPAVQTSGIFWRVTVTVLSAAGAPLSGQSVSLSGPEVVSFQEPNGTTDGSGSFTTSASIPQSVFTDALYISASSSGSAGIVSEPAFLTMQPSSVEVLLTAPSVSVGGTTAVMVRVLGESGVPMAYQSISLSGTDMTFAQTSGTTDGAGVLQTTASAQGRAGTSTTVVAAIGGLTGSAELKVENARLAVGLNPASVLPGAQTQVTVTLSNAAGAVLVGQQVSLSGTEGTTFTSSTGVTDASGQFTTTAQTGRAYRSVIVTASSVVGGNTVANSALLSFQDQGVTVLISPAAWSTGGSSTASRTITIRAIGTLSGAPIAGARVALSAGGSAAKWSSLSGRSAFGVTDSDGAFQFTDTVNANFAGSFADASSASIEYQVSVQRPSGNVWISGKATMVINRS